MGFKPSISQSQTDIRETKSIMFIENLFLDTSVKTHLAVNDKTPDVDGNIEILDDECRIIAKMTVQVKTVKPSDQQKYRFACPTKLFGYASKMLNESVLLLAVDHKSQIVLWKHISQELIVENKDKQNNKTITLHFDENERLSCENVAETINIWKGIYKSMTDCILNFSKVRDENETLRIQLLNYNKSVIDLPEEHIKQVQIFIDSYNNLLDYQFLYIKKVMFPNCWKRGIGLYRFEKDRLEYALYSIKNGESSPLVKQLPEFFFNNKSFDFASMNCCKNEMLDNPNKFALRMMKAHINDFIKQKLIVPCDDDFIQEYVRDIMDTKRNSLRFDMNLLNDIKSFMSYIKGICSITDKTGSVMDITIYNGVNIGMLYNCLKYLYDRGFRSVNDVYPRRGHFCNSGLTSDCFSPDLAQAKLETVISKACKTYDSFIEQNFPMLAEKLCFFKDFDTLVIEMKYQPSEMPQIAYYMLKSNSNNNDKHILFSPVNNSLIYKENCLKGMYDILNKSTLIYGGVEYTIVSWEFGTYQTVISNRFNLMETFYEIMNLRMNEYFKHLLAD